MLKLQILVVIIYTASLLDISEQVPLTCSNSNPIDEPAQDLRVVDGFQRTDGNAPIFLGSNQSLTIIHGGNTFSAYVGVCYSISPSGCYKSETFTEECDNFLRGVAVLDGNCNSSSCSVLACGTNARLPRCSLCSYNDSGLFCSFVENDPPQDLPYTPPGDATYTSCTSDNVDGTEVFQFEKNQNATFLYDSDNGKLLYGVVRASNTPVSIIGLASIDNVTGVISEKVITRTDSQKMVATEAHFVGTPFVRGEYAYLLFREPALEVASLSEGQPHTVDTYYSRIARICRDDPGTTVSSTEILTSYLKQRLVCCIRQEDGECSVEFNEIQDFVVSDDSTTIHAIFTNGQNASPMSALCVFNLAMINETFSTGSFFGSDGGTTNDRWREYDGAPFLPRPGFNCSDPNMGDTNFQRDYNLMQDPAVQTNTQPFYLEGDRFSNLELDNGQNMYIISSERGCLYQLNVDSTETDLGSPCPDPVVNDPIKDLELLPDNKYLITTSGSVYDISNCIASEEPQEVSVMSPRPGNFTARPNSDFEFVIDITTTGSPTIICNETLVTESNERAYLVLKKESLDATDTLIQWRIRILNDCSVTFNVTDLSYTIQPYDFYTQGELEQRCIEWEKTNATYEYLNDRDTCGSANEDENKTGSFNSLRLLENEQVQNCADCPYNDCTENTCTP